MAPSKAPPALPGNLDSNSQFHSRSTSTPPEASLQFRRQSLAALSDSQGATVASQDTRPSRNSTVQSPTESFTQNAKDVGETKNPSKPATSTTSTTAGLDPLSTQIYLRTNSNAAEPSIAQRLRNQARSDVTTSDRRQSSEISKPTNAFTEISKDRRKGPSFLSRLSMRGSWRKDDDVQDSDSELGDLRTDGTNARALTSVMGAGGGFIPLYKEPPRYIRVKAHNKKGRDFDHLFLAQELMGSSHAPETNGRAAMTAVGSKLLKGSDAIWAAEFSLDGGYLAVAGKDQIVRVFAVISTPEERRAHEEEETLNGTTGEKLSAPVFRNQPVREFLGHTGEILALSWSKNNFLLSSSMDKTVRLWHMSRSECLCTFAHKDVVTSIAFHPTDDRFFLAGSLDAQLRLWSIPDRTVEFQAATGEFITAVAFTPDGEIAICGVLSGMCTFYATEGLKMRYQIHVRSSRGKNAKGSKITGIRTMAAPSNPGNDQVMVLVTSNDSRIRVYNLDSKLIQVKYKGLENQSSQIHARFSDDGRYVICGSEDRKAYIWKLGSQGGEVKDKQPYESFDAHPEVVTTALMAPTKTRQLLSASGDPIYDLSNPPPVMLRSLEENSTSQSAISEENSDLVAAAARPEESPAYLERSKHPDGNIIVTTDRTGKIKVFRQDCAYSKRQQGLWETGSKFSGRIVGVGRSSSIMTKTSAGSRVQSRRGSLSMGGNNALQIQHATDRINSWRQDIDGGKTGLGGTPTRSERSSSPNKQSRSPLNLSAANLSAEARKPPVLSSLPPGLKSPTGSLSSNRTTIHASRLSRDQQQNTMTSPPTPSFSLISASDMDSSTDNNRESGFWTMNRWRNNRNSVRNSAILSAPTSPPDSPAMSHNRSSSAFLSPRDRPSARMSIGVGDLRQLRKEEVANRRRSAGPTVTSRLTSQKDVEKVFDAPAKATGNVGSDRKRVDSGVGRMSADSSESRNFRP